MSRWTQVMLSVSTLCAAVLVTGCSGKRAPGLHNKRDAADIRLWGFASEDPRTGREVWYDVRADLPAGLPLRPYYHVPFVREALLHIEQQVAGQRHRYCALAGPDWQTNQPAELYVESSVAEPYLVFGWILLIGSFPSAETDITHTSSDGTEIVMRVERGGTPRDYIYNLPTSPRAVEVRVKGGAGAPIAVPPGQYLTVTPRQSEGLEPRGIDKSDRFLAHVEARKAELQLNLTECGARRAAPSDRGAE